jgi:hypothetical protein
MAEKFTRTPARLGQGFLATAAQIERDCPEPLWQIGEQLKQEIADANQQKRDAKGRFARINELLAEAGKLCDEGGFKKFCKIFCPNLKKSQAYAWLALATGTKTYEQHLEEQRKRKQKSRQKAAARGSSKGTVLEAEADPAGGEPENDANQEPELGNAAPGQFSVTVTENSNDELAAPLPPEDEETEEAGADRAGDTVADDEQRPVQTLSLIQFAAPVRELIRITKGRKPSDFVGTSISVEDFARVGRFFTALAKLEKSRINQPITVNLAAEDDSSADNGAGEKEEVA